jgi:hypothetical protein
MKIFDFTEAKKARIAAARLQALRVMRAALIAAVAIVSGILVVAYCGQALLVVGLWLMQLAVTLALGFAIGSIAYSLAEKLITTVWKPVIPVDLPF